MAIEVIIAAQQADGGFISYSSADPQDFSAAVPYRTTFATSLILGALPADPRLDGVTAAGSAFLTAEASEHGSYNYWAACEPERAVRPYPDDLDDTACALIALNQACTPESLAQLVRLLTAVEVEPGGPYRTWLVDAEASAVWQDIDAAVNGNIAFCLSRQGIVLPKLQAFLAEAPLASPYYPSPLHVCYLLARSCPSDRLKNTILDARHGADWGSPLANAMAVTSLLRLGYAKHRLAAAYATLSGTYPAEAFCIDPSHGQPVYAGSSALTAAFCLEAMAAYEKPEPPKVLGKKDPVRQKALLLVEQRIGGHADSLRPTLNAMYKSALKTDSRTPIASLPAQFSRLLSRQAPTALLAQLGAATLWGWMAYTAYDDLLDGDGAVENIPAANCCLREMLRLFSGSLPKQRQAVDQLLTHLLDQLEAANGWEMSATRFLPNPGITLSQMPRPDYADLHMLADRSIGHALGPLILLQDASFTTESPEFQATVAFFRHFLIARQLNDDAHDWADDLLKGQVSSVAASLLPLWKGDDCRLDEALPELKRLFWEDHAPAVCARILSQTAAARQALVDNLALNNPKPLTDLLNPIEASANKALAERENTLRFIASYTKK